jgi:integrase
MAHSPYVFPGRRGKAMTGWSKRLPRVYKATAAAKMPKWEPHDLRRTMRTGLGRLDVDRIISELLLNHAISDELTAIYDRADYWQQRVEAAARWADHVTGAIAAADKVVQLRTAR